jgi:hypothetical protein
MKCTGDDTDLSDVFREIALFFADLIYTISTAFTGRLPVRPVKSSLLTSPDGRWRTSFMTLQSDTPERRIVDP